ncbi:MAG: hypothetical protein ACLFRO_05080 [Desulfobacterales bacterium]
MKKMAGTLEHETEQMGHFRYEKIDGCQVNGKSAWRIYQFLPGAPGASGQYAYIGIGAGQTKTDALKDLLDRRFMVGVEA